MNESVNVRELRNTLSKVLKQVEQGKNVTVLVGSRPVAQIMPLREHRKVSIEKALEIAVKNSADSGLRTDLKRILEETTDDL